MLDDRAFVLDALAADDDLARRLDIFVSLLARWRHVTNLISPAAFARVWTRHIADCAQLLDHAGGSLRWVDMGAGAGFPGLIIAMRLARTPGALVHLIESDKRKCAFLREVARETASPVVIQAVRIESASASPPFPVDAVTARALATLPKLVRLADVWLTNGALGIFPRGPSDSVATEKSLEDSEFRSVVFPSKFDRGHRVVRVTRGQRDSL